MTLLAPNLPEGFDAFWESTFNASAIAPIDVDREPSPRRSPTGHRLDVISFYGVDGTLRHGWVALPEEPGPHPAFLWIAPYGRWSMPPDAYGTRPGYVSLSFNFFGEPAFHEEVYRPERGYFAEGIHDPETWVFRRMAQDAALAVRLLEGLREVDPERIGAMGLSQGGGIAIWLGAWVPAIRAVVADFPFLSGMRWVMAQRVSRYPLKELLDEIGDDPTRRDSVMRTLSFFDTVNQATRCRVPTLCVSGLKDPAVRPDQVRAVHDALPGERRLEEIDWGHDWHPSMVARNAAWLDAHLT